ncbi:MAG: DegT/DnrJ/EryC1/StrS family aminotransferase [Hyphomicrobiales bacterium]|nr:DegT/DnrJ/EryC1/StrS family aminotransferase [Hyphomicrobiales bacterium]
MTAGIKFLDVWALTSELREDLDAAWRRVADSGWFILGPELEAFESEFAAYCGVKHCIGVGNGLEALRLILEAYGISAGDEVLVPAHTFIATWLAVSATGAQPVPVDVGEGSFLIDPDKARAVVTENTRAVVAVHLYGEPVAMNALASLAARHGLRLIEDAAQAHGASWRGRRTGGLGDAAAFSFYPAKNLGALGDGGAVTTNDSNLAERLRMLRNYGATRKYHHEIAGTNSRLDELQAAFLRVKLKHLDHWNRRRTEIARAYDKAFRDCPLALPAVPAERSHAWHLYVVRSGQRDALQRGLTRCGIESHIHYPVPPHLSGAYQDRRLAVRPHLTEQLCQEVLSLPMDPSLSNANVETVITAVKETLQDIVA